jgi:hypothetical protein
MQVIIKYIFDEGIDLMKMTLKHYIVRVLQHTHDLVTLCKSKYY